MEAARAASGPQLTRSSVGRRSDPYTNVQSKLQAFTGKGRCWHQSVSPTLVLARLGNATASLPLRGQPRRKALRSYHTGQVRRKEKGCHYISASKICLD